MWGDVSTTGTSGITSKPVGAGEGPAQNPSRPQEDPPCWHPDLGLAASSEFLLCWRPSMWSSVTAAAGHTQQLVLIFWGPGTEDR